jgi:hypothetical protein
MDRAAVNARAATFVMADECRNAVDACQEGFGMPGTRVTIHEPNGVPIVECSDEVQRMDDAVDLLAACVEAGSRRLLLDSSYLPPAFFDLSSRFAGEFLQKLENYRLQVAGVFPGGSDYSDRFREFLAEARTGRSFRTFDERSEAEAWLASR